MSVYDKSFGLHANISAVLRPFSNPSVYPLFECFGSRMIVFLLPTFSITYILFLPLPIFVLCLGYQRWRRQRSVSTAGTSHCDVFTYHSILMQLNEVLGFTVFLCGGFVKHAQMMSVGISVSSVTAFGQVLFQLLTCLMRYLAVVHPVAYRGLRQAGGVRVRNISIGCVWVMSSGYQIMNYLSGYEFRFVLFLCHQTVVLVIILICSVLVLHVLKHQGPVEVGGTREHVDQSKRRAFHTMVVIMAVLLVGLGGSLIINVIFTSSVMKDGCFLIIFSMWFSLPTRQVLPLLFLHRAGKLQCCQQTDSD